MPIITGWRARVFSPPTRMTTRSCCGATQRRNPSSRASWCGSTSSRAPRHPPPPPRSLPMLRRPLPIGEHHTLVQLKSGEYICVDTRSLDSIAYLLGWELEGDVIRVLRTFLTQQSVVLDIGANVGLYTALVASIVKEHGRLFAFEGNPRVFAALQRTLVANEVIENPNIIAANLLVSDRSGRGILHYTEEWPVGGTMSDIPLMGQERHSVEVAMTTIDDYLPGDLAVDLVKVDVEGHE